MEWAQDANRMVPRMMDFQVGEDFARAGVPALVGTGSTGGVAQASATGAADMVGVTVDTATRVTAQQTDGSDTERSVRIITNPNGVYRAKLSGGATRNTALTQGTVATADTAGDDVDTDVDYSSPSMSGGVLWGYTGANAGKARQITGLTGANADIAIPFPADIAVGDIFLHAPFWPGMDQFVQLTSEFDQINASVAVDTDNANFRVLALRLRDQSDEGDLNSQALIVPFDMLWAAGGSV